MVDPTYYARGVVIGTLRLETVGETSILCYETGLQAKVNFKAKPMSGGEYN